MKVKIYFPVILTGLKRAGSDEVEIHEEMIDLVASFPALPREGEILEISTPYLCSCEVAHVNWFDVLDTGDAEKEPYEVFTPVVYTKPQYYFNDHVANSPNMTLTEKCEMLKRMVEKPFDCSA